MPQSGQITLAVQCHNFQKRLCWMLSSLIEQVNPALLVVDVAHMPDNGNPRTEDVVEHFSGRLHIKDSRWTDYSTFQKRGWVRNRQLAECTTEWMVFADTDMVYHPEYFSRLIEELKSNHAQATYMLSSGRLSNPKEAANVLVNAADYSQNTYIHDAFKRAQTLPSIIKRNVGAGFSQIINFYHAPTAGTTSSQTATPIGTGNRGFKKPVVTSVFVNASENLAGQGENSLGGFLTI